MKYLAVSLFLMLGALCVLEPKLILVAVGVLSVSFGVAQVINLGQIPAGCEGTADE